MSIGGLSDELLLKVLSHLPDAKSLCSARAVNKQFAGIFQEICSFTVESFRVTLWDYSEEDRGNFPSIPEGHLQLDCLEFRNPTDPVHGGFPKKFKFKDREEAINILQGIWTDSKRLKSAEFRICLLHDEAETFQRVMQCIPGVRNLAEMKIYIGNSDSQRNSMNGLMRQLIG